MMCDSLQALTVPLFETDVFNYIQEHKWSDACELVQADNSSCTAEHMWHATCLILHIYQLRPLNLADYWNCKKLSILPVSVIAIAAASTCRL